MSQSSARRRMRSAVSWARSLIYWLRATSSSARRTRTRRCATITKGLSSRTSATEGSVRYGTGSLHYRRCLVMSPGTRTASWVSTDDGLVLDAVDGRTGRLDRCPDSSREKFRRYQPTPRRDTPTLQDVSCARSVSRNGVSVRMVARATLTNLALLLAVLSACPTILCELSLRFFYPKYQQGVAESHYDYRHPIRIWSTD